MSYFWNIVDPVLGRIIDHQILERIQDSKIQDYIRQDHKTRNFRGGLYREINWLDDPLLSRKYSSHAHL